MLRIDDEDEAIELRATSISEQDFFEDDLREWILSDARSILGEDVLLIGREVGVKEIGDAIDLLGIDRDGNIVIIELKQGEIKGNVDFQALKYAAYASYWSYEQLRDQFEKFKSNQWGREIYDEETTFTEALDTFCNDDYTLNQDQRILIVGESLEDRVDHVARWLSDRDIDISITLIQLFEDDSRLYLDAERVIPVPTREVSDVNPDTSEEPWKDDGRNWHLNEVSNDATAELLEGVVAALEEVERLDGPDWGQQQYLSFKQDRKNRVILRTQKTLFNFEIYDIPAGEVDPEALADALGIEVKDIRAEPEGLRGGRPGVRITCRGGQPIDTEALADETRRLLSMGN